MNCAESQKLIELLLEGRHDLGELQAHADTCSACRDLFEIHRRLAGLENLETAEPSDADLLELRREVTRKLRTDAGAGERSGWLAGLFGRPAFAAALGGAILVVGFLVGVGGPRGLRPRATTQRTLTENIEFAAAQNRRLAQTEDSPYIYSNLQVKQLDEETLALSFDVSTHLDLIRAKDDPLVTEILVQSLVNSSPLDTRLEAISLAPPLEPKVRDALISALLGDADLAVRLKAIDKLAGENQQHEVQQAFLDVLKREKSVRLRLLAIDNLTAGRVRPEELRAALEAGLPEPGTAIETRAQNYLAKF